MKQSYSRLWPRLKKSVLLLLISISAFFISNAQTYWATLSGPAEVPPNSSIGTGKALVTIDGNTMRVQTTFSGLTGTVTASHIHAPTAVAGTGTAGVATTTPTFPGFPQGVTAGTYDQTFDMTLASSYRAGYITLNGGTTASAFTAFKTALTNGMAYLNIHSSIYPGGEIRGFLMSCSAINVTIPDAYAMPKGTLPNTVYPAYGPASSLTLSSNVTGGAAPYSYAWSNGNTTSSVMVSPTTATTYKVTVTDVNGCMGMTSKTVNVMDISGGNKGDKIVVCHNGNSLTIAASAVPAHIAHADMLGGCSMESRSNMRKMDPAKNELAVRLMANPSSTHFDVQIASPNEGAIALKVCDLTGRMMETKTALRANQTVRIGAAYGPGTYVAEFTQGQQRQTVRLIKVR